jgi:hypothetical protein
MFACHQAQVDTMCHEQIPPSQAIFDAGFSIDSLMKKYQDYDFCINRNKDCYRMKNPTSLHPFELIFIKLKFSIGYYQHI